MNQSLYALAAATGLLGPDGAPLPTCRMPRDLVDVIEKRAEKKRVRAERKKERDRKRDQRRKNRR